MDDRQGSKGHEGRLYAAVFGLVVVGFISFWMGLDNLTRLEGRQSILQRKMVENTEQVAALADAWQQQQGLLQTQVEACVQGNGQLSARMDTLAAGQTRLLEAAVTREEVPQTLAALRDERSALSHAVGEVSTQSLQISEQLSQVVNKLRTLSELTEAQHAGVAESLASLTDDRDLWSERLSRIESMQTQVSQATQRNHQALSALIEEQTETRNALARDKGEQASRLDGLQAGLETRRRDQRLRLEALSRLVTEFEGRLDTTLSALEERQGALVTEMKEVKGATSTLAAGMGDIRDQQDAMIASLKLNSSEMQSQVAALVARQKELDGQIAASNRNQQSIYQAIRLQGDQFKQAVTGLRESQDALETRFATVDGEVALIKNNIVLLTSAFTGLKLTLDGSLEGLSERVDSTFQETLSLGKRLDSETPVLERATYLLPGALFPDPAGGVGAEIALPNWGPLPLEQEAKAEAAAVSADAVSHLVGQ